MSDELQQARADVPATITSLWSSHLRTVVRWDVPNMLVCAPELPIIAPDDYGESTGRRFSYRCDDGVRIDGLGLQPGSTGSLATRQLQLRRSGHFYDRVHDLLTPRPGRIGTHAETALCQSHPRTECTCTGALGVQFDRHRRDLVALPASVVYQRC